MPRWRTRKLHWMCGRIHEIKSGSQMYKRWVWKNINHRQCQIFHLRGTLYCYSNYISEIHFSRWSSWINNSDVHFIFRILPTKHGRWIATRLSVTSWIMYNNKLKFFVRLIHKWLVIINGKEKCFDVRIKLQKSIVCKCMKKSIHHW